jgi:CHAD domain-containing protein
MALAGLHADQAYGEAGRLVIGVRARELFAHAEGLLDLDEPERVHDMRVATRRLRAGLEVFAACFPEDEQRDVLAQIKKLARVLGERRDCDVQIEILAGVQANVGRSSERAAIDELLAGLRVEQQKANRRLRKALAEVERKGLAARLERLTS